MQPQSSKQAGTFMIEVVIVWTPPSKGDGPVCHHWLVLRSDPCTIEATAPSCSTGKARTAPTIHAGVPRPAATNRVGGGIGGGLNCATFLVGVFMFVVVGLVDHPDSSVDCAWSGEHDGGWVEGVVC